MLAGLFLACATATFLANVALLLPVRRGTPAARRVTAASAGAAAAGCGVALLAGLDAPGRLLVVAAVVLAVLDLGWLWVSRSWSARGHAAWAVTSTFSLVYLAYVLDVTLHSGLSAVGLVGGFLLWLIEAAAFVLSFMWLWEIVDVIARRRWPRRVDDPPPVPDGGHLPFVSLHVPAHNEPSEMVIETLRSLLALDYPHFEIVMLDDNTDDEALWHPVAEFCAANGIKFHHLADWPGYKSGALNFGLTVTDPRAEVIGVIDADYLVDDDYLRRVAPLFSDPRLAFVQTPQHYRDWRHSAYFRRLFYSYEYFFAASQLSRNEQNGPIFAGTMGLIRKAALESVGGWDEWVITEDAELSLELLRAGWSGLHVNRPFGAGVMPLTWEALKGQRFRWCFGGIQILRKNWRSLLPWDRDPDNRLTLAQRWAYLTGGLQWFGDPVGLALVVFLLAGGIVYADGSGLVFRRVSGALLVAPAVLLGISLARAVVVLRARTGASVRDALGALGIWLALSWTVTLATVRGLFEREGVFLRTPKTRDRVSLLDALRANRVEAGLAVALIAVAAAVLARGSGVVADTLAALLLYAGAGYAAAPFNSRSAMSADLPDALRRRRATERLRDRVASVRPVPLAAGAAAIAGVGALALILLGPASPAPTRPPLSVFDQVRGGVGPNGGSGPAPSAPAPSVSPAPASPAPGGGSGPAVTPSASVSPTTGSGGSPSPTPSAPSTATPSPAPTLITPPPSATASPAASPAGP